MIITGILILIILLCYLLYGFCFCVLYIDVVI